MNLVNRITLCISSLTIILGITTLCLFGCSSGTVPPTVQQQGWAATSDVLPGNTSLSLWIVIAPDGQQFLINSKGGIIPFTPRAVLATAPATAPVVEPVEK